MQQKYKLDKFNDDIIYYDTSIYNNSSDYKQCKFSQVRGSPLLLDSEEYNMSIVRFKVPTSLIPIFNFIPQPKYLKPTPNPSTWTLLNPNPDLGIYSITFSYGGSDHQVFLELQPGQSKNTPPPNDWTTIGPKNYTYYGVYSYRFFMNIINQALQKGYYYCQNNAPFNTSPTVTMGAQSPFLSYSSDNQLFTLNASKFFSQSYVGLPTLEIYFNHPLSDYFKGFLYDFSNPSTTNGKFDRLSVIDVGNNIESLSCPQINYFIWSNIQTYGIDDVCSFNDINYVSITAANINNQPDVSPGDWTALPLSNNINLWFSQTVYAIGDAVIYGDNFYVSLTAANQGKNPVSQPNDWELTDKYEVFKMVQEYPSLYQWEIFTNLIFTSNALQVSAQNQGYNLLTDEINSTYGSSSTSQLSVLTDFDPLIDQGVLNRNYLQYSASGPYRLINIYGHSPFDIFDYSIFWVDKFSNIYQLLMDQATTSNAKFMFQKKGLRS